MIQKILEFQKNFYQEISFSHARKKEFDDLMKKPVNLETHVKIKFPNKFVFECNFGVIEDITSLFKILDTYLTDRNYYLFIPPFNNKRFTKKTTGSFQFLDLTPDVTLNLLFENDSLNK